MYSYNEITSVHLEVTSKCQARCPMCPRRLNGGPLNPFISLDEITLERFKNWFPIDFITRLKDLNMCGNLGDPIIARDTLEIFKYLRHVNPSLHLHMHTNGSARSTKWWEELAEVDVFVVFGIDGLKDTHHLYRVSTDWDMIIENAKAFINAGGNARWDMLVFSHNLHQIDDCKQLSKELGFKDFYSKDTSRFREEKLNVINDQGRTTHILYPTDKSSKMTIKVKQAQEESSPLIFCKAKENKQIYVSSTGAVSPCCWLDMEWMNPSSVFRIDYMDKIKDFPNLNHISLEEIFETGYFDKISSCWNSTGLKECSKQCGSFNKLEEQFSK